MRVVNAMVQTKLSFAVMKISYKVVPINGQGNIKFFPMIKWVSGKIKGRQATKGKEGLKTFQGMGMPQGWTQLWIH